MNILIDTRRPCPHCGGPLDVANRVTGDIVLHHCGAAILIRHRQGGTDVIITALPATQHELPFDEER